MKYFISFLFGALLHQVIFAQCSKPVITTSGSITFCPGGSVTLSAPTGNTWAQKTDFGGSVRSNATGFSVGSKGYIGTGSNDSGYTKDFWEYDPSGNVWTQKADFGGSAREYATGFSVGSKGYIGTGYDGSLKRDFWEYDPSTNVWTPKANFGGPAREAATGFSIGNKGYIGTGVNFNYLKDFWEYDPSTNVWTPKTDFGGLARYEATGFSIGSKGYIGTGNIGGDYTNDFWEYDPSSNEWTPKANFGGVARYNAAGFSIGSKGYIGTGWDGNYQNDFWEYDPSTNVWTPKANFGGPAREAAIGFSIGSKGYIGTGTAGSSVFNDLWEYDPVYTFSWSPGGQTGSSITVNTAGTYTVTTTNALGCSATSAATTTVNTPATPAITASGSTTFCAGSNVTLSAPTGNVWTKKAGFGGTARSEATGFSIGSKGYIGTGSDSIGYTKDFWEYDPSTNVWTQKANFGGVARNDATGFSIGSKGYIGTGYNDENGYLKDFWEYDPYTNEWTPKANFGGAVRNRATGFSIGNKGYIGTGSNNIDGNLKDFWEYNPSTNTWTPKADFGGLARYDATGFSIGSKGYIGTGHNSGGSDRNDFWEYDPSTNVWTPKANFGGSGRSNAIGFSIGSKGYIGMGANTDFWEYNPATNVWTQKTSFGGPAANATGFSIGSKGYISGMGGINEGYLKDFWEYAPDYTYSWSPGGQTTSSITVNTSGNYTITFTNTLGCSATSAATIVTVNTPVAPVITASGPTTFCAGGSVTLSAPTSNSWAQKSDFGGPAIISATGFSIGSKGYIGTGFNGSNYTKEFWEYDPSTNVWTQKADFGGTARKDATGFSMGNKGYIGTGWDGNCRNDFWEYDPYTNVWMPKANFGGTARYSATGFSIGSKGYVGTGSNDNSYTKDFWEYDPSTNIWTQRAEFRGSARVDATGFSIGSKGYIGTGKDSISNTNDFWEYDPSKNAWAKKMDFGSTARYDATGFSIGSKGYIGMGFDGSFKRDFREYNQASGLWTQRADYGGPARYGAAGFSIGNQGYIGTGSSGTINKDFWEYDQDSYTYSWSPGGQNTSSITVNTSGNYTVTATNTLGCSATSAATIVTVNPMVTPAVSISAGNPTICSGTSVTFTVTPTNGGTTPTYQWQKNGAAISGATGVTYTTATLANNDVIRVIMTTNAACTTIATAPSNPITITVIQNPGGVMYVDSSRASSGNGTSWATAYKELRDALNVARQCTNVASILIAKGTYKPTSDNNRDTSFALLRGGLKLFGGYSPGGGGTRNIAANPTILSGDIGTASNSNDNSYHVVVIAGLGSSADSVVLDGFTIAKGNANGSGSKIYNGVSTERKIGGGMALLNNSTGLKITIRNCTFLSNGSSSGTDGGGGGMYNSSSSPAVLNCTFSANSGYNGGGMYNSSSSPTVTNCAFSSDTAVYGGGMTNASSAPLVTNCTFSLNNSSSGGGGIYNHSDSDPFVTNCIVWGNTGSNPGIYNNTSSSPRVNYSLVQGSGIYTGTGNLNADPLFVNTTDPDGADNVFGTPDDGLRLQYGSPAANHGFNDVIPGGATDITAVPRIQDGTVDMGAYEGIACPATPTVSVIQPSCSFATGTIMVNTPTGAGITYSINGTNYQASNVFNNIASGNYNVTAKNGSGCVSAAAPVTINAQPATPATPVVNVTQPTCSTPMGTITINNPTGTGITYSIDGSVYQASNIFSNVAAGSYNVTAKASNGCVSPAFPVTINAAPSTPATPGGTVTQPSCSTPTGIITINSPTGAGITYSNNGTNYQSSTTFSNVAPGSYNITARNSSGCVSITAFVTIDAQPATPATPAVSVTQTTGNVASGTITVNTPTGAEITYSIDNTNYQTSNIFSNLTPGNYNVTAKNSSDCISAVAPVNINAQPAIIVAGSATIIAQSCMPGNGVIDPGETVTVSFCIQNNGGASTTDLTGTLQNTGGVINASGPQNYGAISPGGSEVCRSFTFTANGTCGSTITANISFQDGATNLGTVTYTFTLGALVLTQNPPVANTNSASISIPISGAVAPYSSNLTVSGITNPVSKVTVQLNGLNHTWPADLDILLVSPTGQKVMLMSDAGYGLNYDLKNANLIFDDAAASSVPINGPIPSNATTTYKPTDDAAEDGAESLPDPAPARPYTATLSYFNGLDPNGTWRLYVADDFTGEDGGSITGGWTLTLTTTSTTATCCGAPVITAPTVTQPSCSTSTGTIVVNATGSSTLEYSVNNGANWQLSNTFSGLLPGNYNIQVRLQANPASSTTYAGNPVMINAQPATPAIPTVTVTQPTGNVATGTITVNTPTGAEITYSINNTNYQTSNIFSNVAPGNYNVTAKNSSDCISAAASVTINAQPASIVAGSTTIIAQSCMPGNGVIDPGETVTVSFCIQNNGGASTTDLTGTLQNTGGVINASGPQNYGAISPGGSEVCRSFTFTPSGACGSTITASISFQDGATNLGNVSYTFTLGIITQISTTNTNSASISIPEFGAASLYPSNVTVSGITDPVSKVTVQINGLNHTYPSDLNILLVSPAGQKVMLMSYAGSRTAVTDANLIFDDAAASSVPSNSSIPSNATTTYKPVDFRAGDGEPLPAPAPARPYTATLSSFNGLNPNGTWSLYVADDANGDAGSITGGWTLNITTITATCCTNSLVINAPTLTQSTCTTSTGTIVVNATGNGTLEYSVTNGTSWQLSKTFSGLLPGNYTIKARLQADPANSTTYAGNPVIINAAPATPATPMVTVIQPSCSFTTGTITVNTPTGTGITYSINNTNYQVSNVFNNVAPGNYNVTVKNSSGCVSVAAPVTINAAPAIPATPTVSVIQPTCNTPMGTITIDNPTGAGITHSIDGSVYQTGTTFSNIAPGNYNITAKSSSDCVSSPVPVTINTALASPPTPTVSVTQPTCSTPTGTVTVNSPTGSGITYSINGTTYQTSNVFSNVAPGNYNVTAKNSSGCVSTAVPVTISAAPAAPATPVVSVTQPTCSSPTGTITVTTPNGAGITYSINSSNYQASNIFNNVAPGSYNVTAKNSSGCVSAAAPAIISAQSADNQPPSIPSTITAFLNASGQKTLLPSDVAPFITDNCAVNPNSITVSANSFTCANMNAAVPHQAYVSNTATGNQAYLGEMGMDFTVNNPNGIQINQLGAFDYQANGITGTQSGGVRVAIFNKATQAVVPGLDVIISGSADPLVSNHRIRSITPVTLTPGNYVIVAKGYNAAELNGNAGVSGGPFAAGDNGSGAITYTNRISWGANNSTTSFGYPPNAQTGSTNEYHAGTFNYTLVAANTVTISASDMAGNPSTVVAMVNVVDTFYTLTTKNATVYLDGSGHASIQPTDVLLSLKNNCGATITTSNLQISPSSFDCSNITSAPPTPHQAYVSNIPTGNQSYLGEMGMDFTVNTPGGIQINQLGAFDHQSNGISGTQGGGVRVAIFNRATQAIVPGLDVIISSSADPLVSNHRMRSIPAVTLMPGNYVIVAKGYYAAELNGNAGVSEGPFANGDNGSGAITYTNRISWGANNSTTSFGYPPNSLTGSTNEYHAGTFNYILTAATPGSGTSVTLKATDAYGTIDSMTATVTVFDNTAPVLPTSLTVTLDASGHGSVTPASVAALITDNCAVNTSSITVSPNSFDCSNVNGSPPAPHQAYVSNTVTGNQSYLGEIGMDFTVNISGGIKIDKLGAFDHQANGITGTQSGGVRVAIFNRATQAIVPGLDVIISGSADPLISNHRMRSITPVTLMPGNYVIVSKGYNAGELNGNAGVSGGPFANGDNGGGSITYTNRISWGANNNTASFGYPPNALTASTNEYHAGSFNYTLAAGVNTVTLSASDMSGNVSQVTANVTVTDPNNSCSSAPVIAGRISPAQPATALMEVSKLGVYPNPTSGAFNVLLSHFSGAKLSIEITDGNGKVVAVKALILSSKTPTLTVAFDLGSKASGIYWIKAVSATRVQTSKVLIQR